MISAKYFRKITSIKQFFSSPLLSNTFCQKEELTIFDRIVSKQIPSQIVYEDDKVNNFQHRFKINPIQKCLAFKDITPQTPVHILLIPKVKDGLTQLQMAEERHEGILGHLMVKVAQIAKENNIQQGYRVVINDGKLGCQSVYHLHIHILGGTQLGWPPGVLGKEPISIKQ